MLHAQRGSRAGRFRRWAPGSRRSVKSRGRHCRRPVRRPLAGEDGWKGRGGERCWAPGSPAVAVIVAELVIALVMSLKLDTRQLELLVHLRVDNQPEATIFMAYSFPASPCLDQAAVRSQHRPRGRPWHQRRPERSWEGPALSVSKISVATDGCVLRRVRLVEAGCRLSRAA